MCLGRPCLTLRDRLAWVGGRLAVWGVTHGHGLIPPPSAASGPAPGFQRRQGSYPPAPSPSSLFAPWETPPAARALTWPRNEGSPCVPAKWTLHHDYGLIPDANLSRFHFDHIAKVISLEKI